MSVPSANGGVPKGHDYILQRPLILQNGSTRVCSSSIFKNLACSFMCRILVGSMPNFRCSSRWPSPSAPLQTHGSQQKSCGTLSSILFRVKKTSLPRTKPTSPVTNQSLSPSSLAFSPAISTAYQHLILPC